MRSRHPPGADMAAFLPHLPGVTQKPRILQSVQSERALTGGRELHLTYRLEGEHPVPAILLLPTAPAPAPAAILLHGYSSRKEVMAGPVGRALLLEGIASLAVDLPLHGSRADPPEARMAQNPLAMARLWRQALGDIRLAGHYLGARREIDAGRLAVVGYSMGALVALDVAAGDARIRAVVLAAGGDLPQGVPYAAALRLLVDPVKAVRKLNGRPLLMVHGRQDRTVLPDQAQRLYDAAREPKEIRWWDAGHRLPEAASAEVARWLGERLR